MDKHEDKHDEKPAREQWATKQDDARTDFARAERPFKYRAGAWMLWLVGYACLAFGVLTAVGSVKVPYISDAWLVVLIAGIVLDAAAVLFAQRLWKKAGTLAKGKQGPIGVVMACFAFAPMALFFLLAKNATAVTKGAAAGAALFSIGVIVGLALGANVVL